MHIRLPKILKNEGPKLSNIFQHLLISANKSTNQIKRNLIWRRSFPTYPINNALVCTVTRY